MTRVLSLLKRVDHAYPYHQCIGYYAEKAGFPADEVERLRSIGLDIDFYLVHGIEKPRYVSRWRLYVPQNLEGR